MLEGYIVAVVSPFKNKKIDTSAFERYINYIINSGISGIVVCGSTGESLSLSNQEKVELVKIASEINRGKVKLIGGVIDPVTDNCVEFIKKTEEYVDYFLCICPFYIKPSQQQIHDHFKKLNDSTRRGIVLYNNPGRVGTSIGWDVFRKLCDLKNIIAVKECASDLSRFSLWRPMVKENFSFLTGNDDIACGALAMGASGIISVSANVAPGLCVDMYDAFRKNDIKKFGILRDTLAPLHELMFVEPSPAPVKYALSKLGFISDELREPLSSISAELRKKIDTLLERLEIFSNG
ncbi:MAG: 4-hydroxy-tetrahydrodipicolinate synthase [Holosporaceae bacterium]|jgi:4-hydroxy-tetrahydrodipicolinate synthase|nr:4-hydroxy-tetrahydrodipicolinate synthase [Holosporaceae bacterium]